MMIDHESTRDHSHFRRTFGGIGPLLLDPPVSSGKVSFWVLLSGGVKGTKSSPKPKACAKLTFIMCTFFIVSVFVASSIN